jgi:RimJ/RimL family protein N-acetyltransferase
MTTTSVTKPVLRTARLTLRPARPEDLHALVALDADPEVRRYVDLPFAPTEADGRATLERVWAYDRATPEVGVWFADLHGTGDASARFVGWIHLRPPRADVPGEPGDLELGWRLERAVWGRGLATEGAAALTDYALAHLRAPRVTATALAGNLASIAVMRKLGLRHVLDWTYTARDGTREPAVLYARSRDAGR